MPRFNIRCLLPRKPWRTISPARFKPGRRARPAAPGPQPDHAPRSGCIAQHSIVRFIARQKSRLASTRTRIPVSAPSRMAARRRISSASRRALHLCGLWSTRLRAHKGCFAAEAAAVVQAGPGATFGACGAAVAATVRFALQTSRLAQLPRGNLQLPPHGWLSDAAANLRVARLQLYRLRCYGCVYN